MSAVAKYLSRYAEPEISAAARLPDGDRWANCLVVPALGESAFIDDLMASVSLATAPSQDRTLVVLVVNGREDSGDAVHAANHALLDALRYPLARALDGGARFGSIAPAVDCLAIDRASPGRRLADKEGVGNARKIGFDVAVAVAARGRLASDWIHTTDADARLSPGYFTTPPAAGPKAGLGPIDAAACVHPFLHDVDGGETHGHLLYEIFLRHYVLGLRAAGSPYAFHTIGSTMGVKIEPYAMVRGFPKREAAEDFYLLNKLAKVGHIVSGGGLVRLLPRRSARVPFGTGRSTARIEEELARGERFHLYHPESFAWLRHLLGALDAFAERPDTPRLRATVEERLPWSIVAALGADAALESARTTRKSAPERRRHLHTWFDAFKTLKFLHAVRDAHLPLLPYEEAARLSPFVDRTYTPENPRTLLDTLRIQDA